MWWQIAKESGAVFILPLFFLLILLEFITD